MRPLRSVLLVGAFLPLMLGCSLTGSGPLPDPAAISLQPADVPPAFQRCAASGEVTGYLRFVGRTSQAARDEMSSSWKDLQREGAAAAAVTVYAQQPAACGDRLGVGVGASVATVVVRFRDDRAASATYQRGMLGFTTPSPDEEVPGMSQGVATGLGRNAWVMERSMSGRSLIVGLWQRGLIVVLLIAVDADPLHAKQAMAAVDGRIP